MKKLLIISMVLTAFLFSCQKNTENTTAVDDQQYKQETVETGLCFNFVYPSTGVFRDGTTATINDNIQYRRLMASCDDGRCFGFEYPISVIFRGGNTVTVENDQQLRRVYNSCD